MNSDDPRFTVFLQRGRAFVKVCDYVSIINTTCVFFFLSPPKHFKDLNTALPCENETTGMRRDSIHTGEEQQSNFTDACLLFSQQPPFITRFGNSGCRRSDQEGETFSWIFERLFICRTSRRDYNEVWVFNLERKRRFVARRKNGSDLTDGEKVSGQTR